MYAIICLEHGGTHLEDFKLRSWKEAASVFWQVARICANAEKEADFEVRRDFFFASILTTTDRNSTIHQHRDLHLGNILVQHVELAEDLDLSSLSLRPPSSARKQRAPLEPQSSGIKVTLIDFTLSRANRGRKEVIFDPLADHELFEGEGQFKNLFLFVPQILMWSW